MIGRDWLIREGLRAGDRVIVAGFQKLAPGMPVKPVAAETAEGASAGATETKAARPAASGK
jgi:membrane fusion protein (multidrug efflux system)